MLKTLLDLPIAAKVLIAPLFVMLCLLAMAGVSYDSNHSAGDALRRITGQALPQIDEVARLKARTAKLDAAVMRSLAYEGAGMKAKRIQAIDKAIGEELAAFARHVAERKVAADPGLREHYEAIERALSDFSRHAKDTIELKSGGLGEAAMMMTSAESAFARLDKAVDALSEAIALNAQAQATQTSATLDRSVQIGLVTLLCALVVSGLVIAWSARMITKPLREAVVIAQGVAAGNLCQDVTVDRNDETGQVLASMAELRKRLNELLSNVQQAAQAIEGASAEIASGNLDLSNRTEQTASALQSTASTVRRLLEQMSGHSEATARANALATRTAETARQGGQATQQAVTVMVQINEQSRRIADIIAVIDGIAFQTNILALNAAVEAARAGEQGRGFAVVAQEVRALAGRSSSAAREIRELIQASVDQVGDGTSKVQAAGKIIQDVVGAVEEVSALMAGIAQANEEQAQGMAHVDGALSAMDASTQQNAALVEQAAAATQSLTSQTQGLRQSLGVFQTA